MPTTRKTPKSKSMRVRTSAPKHSKEDAAATILQTLARRQSEHAYQRSVTPYSYQPPQAPITWTFDGIQLCCYQAQHKPVKVPIRSQRFSREQGGYPTMPGMGSGHPTLNFYCGTWTNLYRHMNHPLSTLDDD